MEKFKKPTLVILILLLALTILSHYAYAQTPKLPNINATWNNNLQQISVTWNTPLTRLLDQEIIVLQYKTADSGWKNIQVSEGSTGKGIGEVEPQTQYTIRLRTYFGTTEYTSNQVNITTADELKFSCWADWTGNDINIGWRNAESNVDFYIVCNDKTVTVNSKNVGGKKSHQDKISAYVNHNDAPQQGETWVITFTYNGKTYSHSVFCGIEENEEQQNEEGIIGPGNGGGSSNINQVSGPIPIFTEKTWPTVMFWYIILASLSGVFIFLAIIRSGYQYMFSATSNPGLKASFSETIERCIIALVVIMTAPMLVGLLIQINDGMVGVFANIVDSIGTVNDIGLNDAQFDVNFINKMIAWPIRTIFIDVPNSLFGLHPLSHLIFNNETNVIDANMFAGYLNTGSAIDLGDPLATVLITLIFSVFNIVFNAIYTIRGWVIIAVLCATPLIVWIWVLSSQKTVIEIWLSELFQTIFMQTWHALTFAVVISVLLLQGRTPNASPVITENLTGILIGAGKFFASFGGIICVGIIIYCSYKLIFGLVVSGDEKAIAQYKANLQKSIIGLILLSLALIITQSIFPHEVPVLQPSISGGESPKITIWQLFFAFFVILPISKMMSNIFMSLLARFGTVDEQALAVGSAGMLGGLIALATAGATGARGAFLGREKQAQKIQDELKNMHGSENTTNPSSTFSSSRKQDNSNIFSGSHRTGDTNNNSGIFTGNTKSSSGFENDSDIFTNNQGTSTGIFVGNAEGNNGYESGSDGASRNQIGPSDSKSQRSGFDYNQDAPPGIYLPSGEFASFDGNQSSDYEEPGIYPPNSSDDSYSSEDIYSPPPTEDASSQKNKFQSTLSGLGLKAAGSTVALGIENTMRVGGYLAGAAVGQGQAFANIFGAAGGHGANVARTFNVGYQLYKQNKGENRAQTMTNLQNLTGRTTSRGAVAQSLMGAALIPLGSHRAASVSNKIGSLIDMH